ncbi:conjugal transfer protein TraR [Sulfurimonas sp.]|uniref:TraR/DksA family transcriptional regulator n=1 Tax=Sulfurimonas sp. TaxID=2022749 RepID=UPI0025FDF7D4|nr:conjugal transfer protein TraR [Sulfurimonas sp.]MBW6488623.1 conjugal transfer protein TraR [Sulfurimonas sp.]
MSARTDLDFEDFEKKLKAEKKRVELNLQAVRDEAEALAFEDEIDDDIDMAELQIENVVDQALLRSLEAKILEIDAALVRIEDGTYGICQKTSKPIPAERLKANLLAKTIKNE